MIRRPPRSTLDRSSAASDVYKRQVLAGLRQRDATGCAVEVTTALFETALMWVSYHLMSYLGSGEIPQPQGSGTAMIAPYQAFPTTDGYVTVSYTHLRAH